MSRLARLIRDPLLHFMAVGALLFALFHLVRGPTLNEGQDQRTIVVDRSALLTFMQYEAMAFEPNYFSAQFDAMSSAERQELIDKYVREESLYREANAMGLDEGDYVIRRRLIQKMLYLIDDLNTPSVSPDEAELRRYFLSHGDRYMVAPSLTFTHVFVDREIERKESCDVVATNLKRELQSKAVRFDEAPRYGDRFPFLRNYVVRTPDYVASQFGPEFASSLMKLTPSDGEWQGPIKSDYGCHLVLLTQAVPARLPDLSEAKEAVRDDFLRDFIAAQRDLALKDLHKTYKVRLDGVAMTTTMKRPAQSKHVTANAR